MLTLEVRHASAPGLLKRAIVGHSTANEFHFAEEDEEEPQGCDVVQEVRRI